jgi:hypothetical protein
MTVTVDSTAHTADATWPSADGFIPANIIFAELSEPVARQVTADSTAYTADNTIYPTADGGILPGAVDTTDAAVIAAEIPVSGGAAHYPRRQPFPVVGRGFGILPQLEGEAHGVVVVAGAGVGALASLTGEAAGNAGVVGRSAAQLVVRAAAIGTGGQAGAAAAVLKSLSVASVGVVGTRGSGSGTIVKLEGAASGRHDDDEAAIMTFLQPA